DSEFAPGLVNGPAAGRVDLLTVLTHEMGHILGLDDDSATDPVTGSVMADVLPLGVRRIHLEGLLPETSSVAISGFAADAGAILSAGGLVGSPAMARPGVTAEVGDQLLVPQLPGHTG